MSESRPEAGQQQGFGSSGELCESKNLRGTP